MREWSTLKKLIWLRIVMGAGGGGGTITTVTGVSPLALANALAHSIKSLTQYGKCVQNGTPTPDAPAGIVCNNGALMLSPNLLSGMESKTLNGVTVGVDAYGVITLSGTCTASANAAVLSNLPLAAGDYTLKVFDKQPQSNGTRIQVYNSEAGFNLTFSMDNDTTEVTGALAADAGVSIRIRIDSGVTYDNYKIKPMFVKGSTAPSAFVAAGVVYADGTDEVLTVIQNLNTDPTIVKATLASGATEVRYNVTSSCIVAPVKPNTTYSIGFLTKPSGGSIFRVVTTKNTVSSSVQSVASIAYDLDMNSYATKTINSGEGAEWMYVQLSNTMSDETFASILIQEGTSLTPPQTVNDVPMLLSVGDITDEKDIISGGVTHRIGYHVFDGTETFSKSSAYGKAFLLNAAYAAWGADKTKAVLCTHFLGLPQKSSAQDDNTCFFNSTGHFYFRVTDNSDTDAFKAWLAAQYAAGTPVIVFFVLAEETTEQTTPHSLRTSAGDNVVEVTSNVDPVELEVEYTQANE